MSLLDKWKTSDKNKPVQGQILKAPVGEDVPLSSGQRRLWFLQQLYPDNPFYNASSIIELQGHLEENVLKESIQLVINQNEILKSSYPSVNGAPVIVINRDVNIAVNELKFSKLAKDECVKKLQEHFAQQAATQFDLANGPLVCISLIKESDAKHILFLTFHHIIIDIWSIGLFKKQVADSYRLLCAGRQVQPKAHSIQFTDYAYWQRNGTQEDAQLDFWKDKLSGDLPILELPKDRRRPAIPSYMGRKLRQEFSAAFSEKIFGLAKQLEVTPFVLLLASYYILLHKHTSQNDLLVGTPLSSRSNKNLEELLGFFVETLVIRGAIDTQSNFDDFVDQVRQNVLEVFKNKDIPFDKLVNELNVERNVSTNPLFQTMFVYDSETEPLNFGEKLVVGNDVEFDSKASKFDLTLFITEKNGKLATIFEYATDLFDEQTIQRFQEHLKLMLESVVENPSCKIVDIKMLTPHEKAFFLPEPNAQKSPFSEFKGIHEVIVDYAKKKPAAIAAIHEEDRITYEAVYKKALALQPIILNYSKGENKIIGLAVDRSVDIVVGMLAILNAGCAYLPIDIDYPKQRVDYMLQDAEVGLVLTQEAYHSDFEMSGVSTISIDKESTESVSPEHAPPKPREDNLAYVIYTSGSTGNPKGVPITHKNILNSTAGRLNYYDESPAVFLLMSSIAFDSSKAGIFWTLCTGGTLLISEKRIEQDIEKLCAIISKEKVSHTLMLPSLYRLVLEYGDLNKLKGLQNVIVAGESCPPVLGRLHFDKLPKTKLYNEYGPTEATVWCTAHQLLKEHTHQTVPIGKPVANASVFLLDKFLQLVPYGAIGDIYIGGAGLAGKYLNRPELTSKMYVKNPNIVPGSELLYKTGDKGRFNGDGELEFLGRSDQQIKIRGFRVELEEIERAIIKNEMVAEAVVLLHQKTVSQDTGTQEEGVQFLAAYIIPTSLSYDERLLRHELKQTIPDYMVPTSFVVLNEFPLLPNGKIDKKALLKLKSQVAEKKRVADDKPLDPIQQKLVAIWEEVLNHAPVTISDNFFELGGDSISSIQIIAKARKAGLQLKANQLFDSQTIEELSLFVQLDSPKVEASQLLVGEVPLTPIQHWFFEIHKAAPHYWNQIVRISNIESVPLSVIETVTKELVSYHDVLRTAFSKVDGEWKARVLRPDEINSFHFFDVGKCANLTEQDHEIDEVMTSLQEGCNLNSGNLFRTLYFDCGEIQSNKVFFLAHHLVTDMVSWNAIFDDFSKAVKQTQTGNAIEFKTKTASIRDWSKYLHELSNSEDIKKEVDFWKAQNACYQVLPTDFEVMTETFTEKTLKLHTSVISKEETALLLTSANNAFNTRIEDLMLSSLVTTFCDWGKLDSLCIGLERHGRNVENEIIDVSNTIGWFTSFFPIKLNKTESGDIGDSIKSVKEHLRAIPNDGIGFGVLKYLSDNDQLDFEYPKLVFNYLGTIGNSQSDAEIRYNFRAGGNRDALSERISTIDINVYVADGKMHINWSYSQDAYKESTFLGLVKAYLENLKITSEYCLAKVDSDYTPSDFPESGLDQDDLDELMKLL